MVRCTTCEKPRVNPRVGVALPVIVDVLLNSTPVGSKEYFQELMDELCSLNDHQHQLAPEP